MKKHILFIICLFTFNSMNVINAYAKVKIMIGDLSDESPISVFFAWLLSGLIWVLSRLSDENCWINNDFLDMAFCIVGYIAGMMFLSIIASFIFGLIF